MITSNLDIFIGILLIFFSAYGLIRGFLKEISSVFNWFAPFYLTSTIKPLVKPLFENKIQIPFLLDIILNITVFIGLMILFSILTNFISIILKKIIPSNVNGSLGLVFGFVKGFLICSILIAFVKILYDKSKDKPEWVKNSYVYNSISNENNFFVNMLNNILGDFAIEKNKDEIKEKKQYKNRFSNPIKNESISNNIDVNNILNNKNKEITDIVDLINIKQIDNNINNEDSSTYNYNQKSLERLINIVVD